MVQRTVESIDKAIAYHMVDEKLTREDVAKELGISTLSLRMKRNGERDWKWSEILKIAEMVGKTPDEIAGLS